MDMPQELYLTITKENVDTSNCIREKRECDSLGLKGFAGYCPAFQALHEAYPKAVHISAGHVQCTIAFPLWPTDKHTLWCEEFWYGTPDDLREQMHDWDYNLTPIKPGTYVLRLYNTTKGHRHVK